MKKLLLASAALMMISPAYAQEMRDMRPLAKGETLLSLSATEMVEIKQDLLQASLRIEVDGKDARKVQDEINTAMRKALDAANAVKTVKTSTGQYNVYSYDPDNQPPVKTAKERAARLIWKGSQTIELEGKDQAALLEIAGKLQDLGFVMNGLNYTISPQQTEAYRDNLMTAALKKIETKADLAAKALGKSGYDISEVNVDGSGPIQPMPVMYKSARMAMASDAVSAPVAQSGEQNISLTVSARVILKP